MLHGNGSDSSSHEPGADDGNLLDGQWLERRNGQIRMLGGLDSRILLQLVGGKEKKDQLA